ncbi:CPBP family intramembrane metalloprotease [Sedimentibacter sp. zth1]|uniref:CPBP family intramembrane glutamic endopeptidase n=1 Tax=Sedimentibacter sp. zth1 TaxID=2816908 RepID=UPI001A919F1B|nr:type II CAAX endopeptidase family protein [Sedimentibacter sp. zth1]QSX05692.1 CPBP family intramembrane metalloprotease [Sedimentibacter sp. zth1]
MKEILKMISPFNAKENVPTILFVIKKILAFILIFFVSMILAEGLAIIFHLIMGYNVLRGEMLDIQTMTLMKYYGYVIFMIIAMLYCKLIEKRSIRSMGFNNKISGYLEGMLIGVVLLSISIGLIMLTGNITYNGILQNIDFPIIFAFLGGFIIQGAMEETLGRGFLMTSLSKKVSIPIAILVSSLAFAAPHFSTLFNGDFIFSLIGIINLLLVSTIFSLLIINGKNIWIACGMHTFWNFFLFNIFGLNLSGSGEKPTAIFDFSTGSNNILNGGSYGIEASVITTFVLLIFTCLLIVKYKKLHIEKITY